MLLGDVLNSDASLNDFDVLGSLSFIQGEQTRLVIRLKQEQRKDKLRFVPPSTALLTITVQESDGTEADLVASVLDPLDRSIWYVDLQESDTELLIGGNILFSLDILGDGTKIIKGLIQNGLSLQITGIC